ncbi:MAG TPA: tetratricopeptide repeat protein [Terriglobia bacterium]|jgi:tetratricopeptide (TPR) repeat protein
MFHIVFVLLAGFQSLTGPSPQAEIKDALAHAEALYYSAHFGESVELLTRIDQTLSEQHGDLNDRIDTKLRLALAYLGLNDNAKAKSSLMELFALNPDYMLDAQQFSPKVISVADDARSEQAKERCYAAQTEARTDVESGQTGKFLDLLRSVGSKCPVLAALAPQAAEALFRTGMASYKAGDFTGALSSFEAALSLSPEHELAREYADLTRDKLQVGQDRLLGQWQRDFNAHDLPAAAADYRTIKSAAGNGDTKTITQVTEAYRKALSGLVDSWNKTCAGTETANMKAIRGQITDLLPEPSFGEDLRNQMKPCAEEAKVALAAAQPVVTKVNTPQGCMEMQSPLAMARLKTRVAPVITDDLRNYLKNKGGVLVHVKVRIGETGDVTVTGVQESNPLLAKTVQDAVRQWKFTAIRDTTGIRCVDTDIPLALKLGE